jgi:hypothetical protein
VPQATTPVGFVLRPPTPSSAGLPIPASSGKTTRHRLDRGGNRQANAALFRIVVVRMRWHPATIA